MNFEIKKNEHGYYGIIDSDSTDVIVPFIFNKKIVISTIEDIEKKNDNYYVLHIKDNIVNGLYDKKNGIITIPSNEDIITYNVEELEKKVINNIKVNDNLTIKKVGNSIKQIILDEKEYSNKDTFSKEIDDFEIIDNKVVVLKKKDTIVDVFDLEDKKFLDIELVYKKDVAVVYQAIKNDNYNQSVSIVDLENKKYLKNVFNRKYKLHTVVDRESYDPRSGWYDVEESHTERRSDSTIFAEDGCLLFDNERTKFIYDIKHERIIKNPLSDIFDSIDHYIVLEKNPSGEYKVYDKKSGKDFTMMPIKVKYYENSYNNYNVYTRTIFRSSETGEYFQFLDEEKNVSYEEVKKYYSPYFFKDDYRGRDSLFDSEKNKKRIVKYNYNVYETLFKLKVSNKDGYDLVTINNSGDDKNVSIPFTKSGTLFEINLLERPVIKKVTEENIAAVIQKIDEVLTHPDMNQLMVTKYSYFHNSFVDKDTELVKNTIKGKDSVDVNTVDAKKIKLFYDTFVKEDKTTFDNLYLIDEFLYIEKEGKLEIKENPCYDHVIQEFIKKIYDYNTGIKRESLSVVTKNDCYGVLDKETNEMIIPCIFPRNSYTTDEVLRIKSVKEIIKDIYLVEDENGLYGINYSEYKKYATEYDHYGFVGTTLKLFYENGYGEEVTSTEKHFLDYYLRKIKEENGNVDSSTLINKMNEALKNDKNSISLTDKNYKIYNENVIVFKIKKATILCVLNRDYPFIDVDYENINVEFLNDQVLLFKRKYEDCMYDLKHDLFVRFPNNVIVNENILCDGEESFYDIRSGKLICNYGDNEDYETIYYSPFIIVNNKVFYVIDKNKKKVDTSIYDLNTCKDKKCIKFTDLKEVNIKYDTDNGFTLYSKDDNKLLDIMINSIEQKYNPLCESCTFMSDVLYIINGKTYLVLKNKTGKVALSEFPDNLDFSEFISEINNKDESKLTLHV